MIFFNCPNCGNKITVKREPNPKIFQCKRCENEVEKENASTKMLKERVCERCLKKDYICKEVIR